jgi:hypothetical protein
MTDIIAKPVVKNKFWIVESGGEKIATIQAIEEGGFAYVYDDHREVFPSIKLLTKKHNIKFVRADKGSRLEDYSVYGYPCSGRPYNEIYDVPRRLPIYTKSSKSKSFFAAGHYAVKFGSSWMKYYCPKIITLNRYPHLGPFKTQDELNERLKQNG